METNALVLIDFDKVDTLLEGFNKSTGFVTAILDLDGNILSKSGWRQMCTEFHRTNPETSKKCTISDTVLANKMGDGEKYHFYKCLNGLVDVAVPIIINGEHIANLFSGQFFFEEPDITFFKKQAKKYGFDEHKYLDALSKVPIVSQEKVKTAMDFLLNMTQMLSDMAFQKLELIELNNTIKKNEEKFKAVFESASVGKSITLPTGEINVNLAFCEMLGYSPEELESKKWQDITPQDEISAVQKILNPMLSGEKDSARFEKRYICKDGSYKLADVSVSLLRDDKGKPLHFITTVIDITERKLAEQALSESEEMMRNSQSMAHICSYSTNLKVDDIAKSAWACSLEFYEIFGIDKTYPHTIEGWAAFIHPDYREEIVAYHEYVIKEKIRFEHEYKIIRINDGAERWVYGTGKLEFDEKGNPIRMHGAIQDITDRKQTELELAESAERYKSLHNASFGGIAIHDKGIILECNQGLSEMTGYSLDELIGMDGLLLIAPEHREMVMNKILTGYEKPYEANGLRKNGEQFPMRLEARNIPYKGKNVRTVEFRDITEGKKAEEKLKLLNRAVEASSVAVEITDAEGNIFYTNPYFSELTGYSYEEALGKNPRFLKSGNHPKKFYKDLWDTILSGKDWTGELQNKKKNGELYWENAVISPIKNSNGKVTHFVAIKEDVTERKRTMEELGAAKAKAEESDRLKTAFLHNISHEIRTPMNAITGFSALLSEPGIDEGSRTFYTDTITQSSDQLLSIINDIVDISNIEAGIVNISKEEVRINRSLEKLEDQFRLKAKEKGLVLRKVAPLQDEEAIIFADNTKFMQVISNLLNNAFKFTNEGTVEFGYKPGKDFIEFYVSDSGIGIPNDQLSKIFDRFYQVDHKLARLNEGTGLGLAISKSFIDLMGGKIWVESEPGKGSTFFFTLPFSGLQKSEETVLPVKRQYTFDREYNILVAEDDTQNSYLIDIFLGNQNLKVTIVSNGAEAVEHCRTGKPVDLVLMDLEMPVMDGFEATRLIKEILPDLPVIAQTAYASEDDKRKALSSGCNDFITKPFRKETLLSKIRENVTLPQPNGLSAP